MARCQNPKAFFGIYVLFDLRVTGQVNAYTPLCLEELVEHDLKNGGPYNPSGRGTGATLGTLRGAVRLLIVFGIYLYGSTASGDWVLSWTFRI